MADTDILAILSEILIKQDRQTEILTQFMEVYVRHFQTELSTRSLKAAYHEKQLPSAAETINESNSYSEKMSSIERILTQMLELEVQIKRLEKSTVPFHGLSVPG